MKRKQQTGAGYLRAKAKRKETAARQQRLREERDAEQTCRTCGAEVEINTKTGKPNRQCKRHLRLDRERKGTVKLEWLPEKATWPIVKLEWSDEKATWGKP